MIEILNTIDSVVWGPAMIALLLGTHIFLTVRTGFIQRKLPQALRMSWGGGTSKGEGDISNFGALATALAATIGTGSIVGVATAILAGGPGAVFWMDHGRVRHGHEVCGSLRLGALPRARPCGQHARRRHVRACGNAPSRAKTARALGGRSSAASRSPRSPSLPPSARTGGAGNVHDRHHHVLDSRHPRLGGRHRHRRAGGHRHLRRRAVHLACVREASFPSWQLPTPAGAS